MQGGLEILDSFYCEPKEEVIMGLILTKMPLPALSTASKIAASSIKQNS